MSGLGLCSQHRDASCTRCDGPGRQTRIRGYFCVFISQLLNDKIRLGPGLDSCIPVFDIRKLCQWYRWWCPA